MVSMNGLSTQAPTSLYNYPVNAEALMGKEQNLLKLNQWLVSL